MKNLKSNPLFKKLLSLNLPAEDYAIFGSGPLFVRDLRETIHDIDVIAREKAWEKASQYSSPQKTIFEKGLVINLFNGEIEIFNDWAPGNWNINDLINTADEFQGIKFVKLGNVLKWKKMLGRPKDKEDIKKIEAYFHSVKT